MSKKAMDAAIQASVATAVKLATDKQIAIREAERAVHPYVGELAIALDSAEAVYQAAFKLLGVKVDGVHPSAFPTILALQTKPGERTAQPRVPAMDAATIDSFNTMYPGAAKITVQ